MPKVLTERDSAEIERKRVYRWRKASFIELLPEVGAELIHELATRDDISPHQAAALVAAGCPQKLIPQILL